jgi:hypothetical protein
MPRNTFQALNDTLVCVPGSDKNLWRKTKRHAQP